MKTRDEMIREHYINIDKIMSTRPRPQTGPKASFMGAMNEMKIKETCCDIPKPKGAWRFIPLALLAAVGTLAVAISIEVGIAYAFGWV